MTLARPAARLVLTWVLTAVVILLAVPIAVRVGAGLTGLCFLIEFLTEGQRPWLSRMTSSPIVEPLSGTGGGPSFAPGDLWHGAAQNLGPWPGLILVHGLTPEGKRDLRLTWTADRLARAGFAVAVPELPELRAQRMGPDDALVIRDTLERLVANPSVRRGPVGVIAVSVGLGPLALALDDPAVANRIRVVLALGGYADARELVRYFTTGAYSFEQTTGRATVDPRLATVFLAQNLDLVPDARDRAAVVGTLEGRPAGPDTGPGARAVLALLQNREPARVDALLDALPPETRQLLALLSPARHLDQLRGRLLVVHGRGDPAIPFTESLRLAAAAPGRSRLVLVDLVSHVGGQAPTWNRLIDLARLWSVCYELLAG